MLIMFVCATLAYWVLAWTVVRGLLPRRRWRTVTYTPGWGGGGGPQRQPLSSMGWLCGGWLLYMLVLFGLFYVVGLLDRRAVVVWLVVLLVPLFAAVVPARFARMTTNRGRSV